jgi:hypothetical protein
MDTQQQSLETLKDIKTMMERSSRFISLSGLSGVAAGICGLIGAGFAYRVLAPLQLEGNISNKARSLHETGISIIINEENASYLLQVALVTLLAAMVLAFLFTWLRSRKSGTILWGTVSRKLTISMLIPMAIGGIFLLKLMEEGSYALLAPGCLIFYGLALVNASSYTLVEIKWLGYCELVTGLIALFITRYGLYFWAFGFGLLHIVYGILMWNRYERNEVSNK